MERLVPLIFLIVLGAGQIIRLPSSYDEGVKWEFGTSVFRDGTLVRSFVDQGTVVPIVYENKESVAPMARKEPAVATVYNKKLPAVPDVYTKKPVVSTVHQKEPIVQNAHKRQSVVVPAVFKAQPVAPNKNQPVVQNVYNLQPPVSTVRKTYPVVSNVYKSQPIRPIVHHQGQHYFPVPKVPIGAQKKTGHHRVWNRHNPHYSFGSVHVSHN